MDPGFQRMGVLCALLCCVLPAELQMLQHSTRLLQQQLVTIMVSSSGRCRDPDVLESEARSALDALADNEDVGSSRAAERGITPEARLLVAVLTLRQLTVHAPPAIYLHVATAVEVLWKPLVHGAARVRFAATDALYALLVLVAPRASRYLQQWHRQLPGACVAFERDHNNMNAVHGGMLALSCLVRVASSEFVLREVRAATCAAP